VPTPTDADCKKFDSGFGKIDAPDGAIQCRGAAGVFQPGNNAQKKPEIWLFFA
jgi:hypothetical protein